MNFKRAFEIILRHHYTAFLWLWNIIIRFNTFRSIASNVVHMKIRCFFIYSIRINVHTAFFESLLCESKNVLTAAYWKLLNCKTKLNDERCARESIDFCPLLLTEWVNFSLQQIKLGRTFSLSRWHVLVRECTKNERVGEQALNLTSFHLAFYSIYLSIYSVRHFTMQQ